MGAVLATESTLSSFASFFSDEPHPAKAKEDNATMAITLFFHWVCMCINRILQTVFPETGSTPLPYRIGHLSLRHSYFYGCHIDERRQRLLC